MNNCSWISIFLFAREPESASFQNNHKIKQLVACVEPDWLNEWYLTGQCISVLNFSLVGYNILHFTFYILHFTILQLFCLRFTFSVAGLDVSFP